MQTYRTFVLMALATFIIHVDGWAHRPVGIGGDIGKDLEHAVEVEDITVSQVVYRKISSDLPQVWMTFDGRAGDFLDVQLGIPEIERLETYRPAVAVIGPGLPEVDVPFNFPDGLGGQIFESDTKHPERFYESFSDTHSWILGNLPLTLPEDGPYYVVAYHPENIEGKLWVALGKREVFGAADVANLPEWLKAVREFHEVEGQAPLVNNAYLVLLGVLATIGFATWWIIRK